MENFENEKKPNLEIESSIREIMSVLQEDPQDFDVFECMGRLYHIIPMTKEDMGDGPEAFFSLSSEIDGHDIYILETLTKEDRHKRLFHELLEQYIQSHGYDGEDAHKIVLEQEEKIFGKRS